MSSINAHDKYLLMHQNSQNTVIFNQSKHRLPAYMVWHGRMPANSTAFIIPKRWTFQFHRNLTKLRLYTLNICIMTLHNVYNSCVMRGFVSMKHFSTALPEGHPEINIAQRCKQSLQPKLETPTKQKLQLHNIRKIRPFLTEHAAQLLVQALVRF